MILITGATGLFGNATINFLLKKGTRLGSIAALVRERKKAAHLLSKGIIVRIGDFDKYASLVEAFESVDKLLLVAGTAPENPGKHENAIKAAKEAGVKHIFYTCYETSYETVDSPVAFLAHPHGYTEKVIKESGITYTIFCNNAYAGTLPYFLGEKASQAGVVFPTGGAPAPINLHSDMAEATADLLVSEGHENKEYHLSNTDHVSCANAQTH